MNDVRVFFSEFDRGKNREFHLTTTLAGEWQLVKQQSIRH